MLKKIELGQSWPRIQILSKLCNALSVDIHRLFVSPSAGTHISAETEQRFRQNLAHNIREYTEEAIRQFVQR